MRFFSPSYVFLLLFHRKSVMAATLQDVCKFVELLCHVCVMPCLMKVHRTIGIVSASCFYSSQTLEIHLFSQNIGCNLCTVLSLWFLTKAQVSPEQVAALGSAWSGARCELCGPPGLQRPRRGHGMGKRH